MKRLRDVAPAPTSHNWLELKLDSSESRGARRTEAVFVVIAVQQVVDLAVKSDTPGLRERQAIAHPQVRFENSIKLKGPTCKGHRVEDRAQVIA